VLTAEEQAAIDEAKRQGYLLRSGRRVEVLLAWRAWCGQIGRKCVVARLGARDAVVEIGDVDVLKVPADDLEEAARKVVQELRFAPLSRMTENVPMETISR
jgi:hypothetical protein